MLKYSHYQNLVIFIIHPFLSILAASTIQAQENSVYAEAPVILEDGVRKSTQITVNFKDRVFDLPQGTVDATIDGMEVSFANLKTVFQDLERRFGNIVLKKQIPDAVWGDVWRTHRVTGKPVRIHEWSQLFYVRFADFVPIDSIMTVLETLPDVDYAHEPIYAMPDVDPNDPDYLNQPNKQWNLFKVQAAKAWDITQGNTTLRIADVETGGLPDRTHPDFWTGPGTTGTSKFDDGGSGLGSHATQVAGIIGAATNDTDGIASLGWNLIMNSYSFSSNSGTGPGSLVEAMTNAIDASDVINCSFSLFQPDVNGIICGNCLIRKPIVPGFYQEVDDIFTQAINLGKIVISSMGNSGTSRFSNPVKSDCQTSTCLNQRVPYTHYPANYAGVIGVTATDISDDVPNDYNLNERGDTFIDIAAPGINVLSTSINGSYLLDNGSSFSAPMVAALAGLMLSINGSLGPSDVQGILENTADPINESSAYAGAGRINAYAALKYTLENFGGTLSGAVTLSEDLTIQAGKTLTIAAGTTVKFTSGVLLSINGTLDVQGTAQAPVTFDRSGTTGTWNGIQLNNGATGTIKYATISNATRGVYANTPLNLTVDNCTIQNFTDKGIYLNSGGNT